MRNRTEGREARRIGEFIEFPDVMQNWYPAQSLPDIPEVELRRPGPSRDRLRADAAAKLIGISPAMAETLARALPGTRVLAGGVLFVDAHALKAAAIARGLHVKKRMDWREVAFS